MGQVPIDCLNVSLKFVLCNLKSAILLGTPLFALCSILLAPCFSVHAQQPRKFASVGVLIAATRSSTTATTEAFRERLYGLGYVEGQNLLVEFRYADGKSERLPAQATELVRLRVDVIAAFGAPAILAAKQATTTIPIVFETLADAVAMGFVPNLVRPGGNITGVTGFASELGGKWLELLREVVPEAKEVALLTNPANPNMPSIVSTTRERSASVEASAFCRGATSSQGARPRLYDVYQSANRCRYGSARPALQ